MPGRHRHRRNGHGQRRNDLRSTAAPEFARHQTRHYHGDALGQCGKESHRGRRGTEQLQRYARDEWCEGRVGDEAPVEVPRIVERRELVAMEAVLAVGKCVERESKSRHREQGSQCRGRFHLAYSTLFRAIAAVNPIRSLLGHFSLGSKGNGSEGWNLMLPKSGWATLKT